MAMTDPTARGSVAIARGSVAMGHRLEAVGSLEESRARGIEGVAIVGWSRIEFLRQTIVTIDIGLRRSEHLRVCPGGAHQQDRALVVQLEALDQMRAIGSIATARN